MTYQYEYSDSVFLHETTPHQTLIVVVSESYPVHNNTK